MLKDEAERLDFMGAEVVVAGGRIRDYPHVAVDDHAIGRTAIQHLIDLGHRRIAMIRTSDSEGTYWSSDSERMQGFRAAMDEAGLAIDPDYVVVEPYAIDAGKRAMRRLLDLATPPTAVFAYSDELAIGALRALQEEGIAVPGQLSLVGVDGHPTARLFGITSVDQEVAAQGRLAGRLVLDRLGRSAPGPRAIRADFHLEVRTTTGPPPD